jgi:hypothetical protein
MLLAGAFAPATAMCQTPPAAVQPTGDISTSGVVANATQNTLVLRAASGQFMLFVYGAHAVKPAVIPSGSTVTVLSAPRSDGVQVAHYITITSAAPAKAAAAPAPAPATAPGTPKTAPTAASEDMVIPESIRNLERGINKQARRFHAGVQGGVGLDPEVILIGLNARMGSGYRDIAFRPNVDFAFGEVTKMFQINLDATYRLPLSPRNSPWSAYVGAGPNFSFVSQNYEKASTGDNGVDFSDFEFKSGLNILVGVEYRSGLFYEMKAGVWTTPVVRFMIGYHF